MARVADVAWAAGFFDGEGTTCLRRKEVHRVLTEMWPYLSAPKREQAHRNWTILKEHRRVGVIPELPEVDA